MLFLHSNFVIQTILHLTFSNMIRSIFLSADSYTLSEKHISFRHINALGDPQLINVLPSASEFFHGQMESSADIEFINKT